MMHDRMTKLYVFQAVFTFLRAMLGLFVPIYLFSLGFSFPHIFFYAMMTSVVFLLAIPFFIWVIRHIGFKFTLLLSIPLYLTHIWTLNFVTQSMLFFHLAWLGFGLYLASFWPAFHSEVAVNGHKGHRGSEVGTLQVLSMFMAGLAPMIGGFVLEAFTYGVLVSLATCMLLIGIVPLLLSKDIHLKHYSFHYADYFKLKRKHKYLRESAKSFRAEGTQNLLGLTIWPIILFILLD
jgi:MFS family permease